jgi:hypothetical protein
MVLVLAVFPNSTLRELWALVGGCDGTMEMAVRALLNRGEIERSRTEVKRAVYRYRLAGGRDELLWVSRATAS